MMQAMQRNRNRQPLFALLTANAISQIGSMLTLIAVPWFVLQTTGSAAQTGITGFVEALPFIIAGFFGGTLVDRIGFPRMSILADVTSGSTVALIPLLYQTVGLAFWQLLVLVFCAALFNTPGATARSSALPDLAERGGMQLERATAALQGIPRLATLIGPPLAGVLIAVIGPSPVLWLDAATFAISALLIGLTAPKTGTLAAATPHAEAAAGAGTSYLAQLREGLRYLRADTLICGVLVIFALTNFLDAPITLLYTVYAREEYGSALALGILFAAFGGGALAGTALFGAFSDRLPRRAIFTVWLVASMLSYASFTLRPALPVAVATLVFWGISAGAINPMTMTVFGERIPAALRGRVYGIMTALSWFAIPIGRALAGFAVQGFGTRGVFLAIALGYAAINLASLNMVALRRLDRPDDPAAMPRTLPAVTEEGASTGPGIH